jgi:rubrerythrin
MTLHEKTKENLITAMHGEAFAYAKYIAFAEHARKDGNPELAVLFEETAKVEFFEHFAEEAQLAGLVGTDIENLQDAISGENFEVVTMYREFAEAADDAGDADAAARFGEVRRDEAKHRSAFQSMLDKMQPTQE